MVHLRVVVGANPYRDIWAYTHESLLQREKVARAMRVTDEVLKTFPVAHKGLHKPKTMVGGDVPDAPKKTMPTHRT